MTWLFAVLLVLALGAIAVVAAGRGEPLAEEHPDRRDVVVPADGPLTGADLRAVRFTLAFRGYRMGEVDALLDRLAEQLDAAGGPRVEGRPDEAPPASPGCGADAH